MDLTHKNASSVNSAGTSHKTVLILHLPEMAIKGFKPFKWEAPLGPFTVPLATTLLGRKSDAIFAVEMAIMFLLFFLNIFLRTNQSSPRLSPTPISQNLIIKYNQCGIGRRDYPSGIGHILMRNLRVPNGGD